MSDFLRFVPDGCEFYQYQERMTDQKPYIGPGEWRPVLQKSLSVRRKSDGLFFCMAWNEGVGEEELDGVARAMAEDAKRTRLGGNRVDLGEANCGQRVRVHGKDPPGEGRMIVAIDDETKAYRLLGSDTPVPWSQAREP